MSIGPRSLVMGPLTFTRTRDAGRLLSIGSDSILTGSVFVDLAASVHIGDRVFIGHDVMLLTVDHTIGGSEQRCGHREIGPIDVGDGVWLGTRVTILPGVSIGAGSVVAAGSVVTKDVPPNSLVSGVPASVRRELDPAPSASSRHRHTAPLAQGVNGSRRR